MGTREPLFCLRAYSETKAFGSRRAVIAILSSGEYTLADQPPLSFDDEIDVLIRGEHMYILDKSPFHRLFPDFEPMMHNADALLTTIRGRFPMRDYERFEEDCRRDPRKIAKLHRIVRNPYFASLTLADLGQIAARHPQLAGVFAHEPDGTETLVYAPGYEWKMLKLLNDDFPYSEMTQLHYDTSSKRVMRQ